MIILVLLVAVGSHPWTEAHDMNKNLNRTCQLEVLPDYPLSSGNSNIGLSWPAGGQRYTYRVLQTNQMKLILLCVWAEPAVLGSTKTALKFKYET